MESDQAQLLDALLNQYAELLNKNHDTEEMDASTMSIQDSRYPLPFDNKDTQEEIIMADKGTLIQYLLNNNQKCLGWVNLLSSHKK